VVSDCVLGFEASSSEHRLDVRLPHDPVVRWADPDAVARIVGNLVTNAIKYTPPDTTVTVSLAVAADAVEITVADDGPGIPADKRDAIFEKFQRGAQTGHGGLGLGLYICRALAKAHGGSVSYAPAERGGSIFTARLSTPVPESPKTIAVTAEH
jgi:signal transduction histidine kinase